MNEDKLQKFYKNAKDLNSQFTMDYDAFKANMQDNEKRSKFYNNIRKLNPAFTMTNEEADAALGFASEQAEQEEQSGWEKLKSGISDMYWKTNAEAREFKEKVERDEEREKKLENYRTAGLTEQDKQDVAALEKVKKENPLLGDSKVSPTNISEETEKTLNRKSEMSSYIQRGEDPGTIHINAFERALNTDEGKNFYNTLLNEAVNEFVNSEEHKAMLEKYKLGQVSEEEINKAFSDKYEKQINEKFAEKMFAKGTPIGDYIEVAEKKVYMKQGASDAMELEGKIDAALEQLEQETNDNFREDYKKIYGVYPEDDKDAKYRVHTISGQYEGKRAMLSNAQKFNKEALTLINAVSRKEEFGDFWRGVGDAATDLDTWDLGIGELTRNVELLDVIKKLEYNETAPADKQLEITENEQMLLDAALNFFTVSAYYSNELGRGYKAGQTSMSSMPFMLEFVMSAGTMAAVDASIKGAARGGAALLVKQLRKRGMQKLAKATTGRVSHMVGSMASGIVSSAINAAYMTGVYGTARIAGGTVERMTGQVKPVWDDENKQFVYGGRDYAQDLGEALWNSAADTYIENLSEMVLAKTLDPMRAFVRGTDVFKKVAKNDLIGAISSIRNNPTFRSLRQATQFGGYFEEVAEEYLGGILRRAAMTDVNNWQQAGLDLDGQIDIFLGLAPTSLLFGATGAASYYGGIAYNSKKLKESMSSDAQRQMFDQLMKESRSGEFKEGAHDFIREILLDSNISEEKKKDIIMGVVQEYQGVLSKKLQEQSNNVATAEFEKEIDKFIGTARLEGTETIIESADESGRSFVIVGGNVGFKEETIDGKVVRTIDKNNSSREIQVRYVKNDGSLREEVSTLRVSNLNMPISEIGVDEFKGLKLAQYKASFASLDTFEYKDGIYDTKTGFFIRTKEEQEQIDAIEQQIDEEVQQPTDAPTINTKPRIIVNEEHKVTVDGKQVTVKLTSIASSPMIQREDGSIKSGDFVVTVDGKTIRSKEAKNDYINAVSEKLKADHAKAVEKYNQRKAEEAAANMVVPQPLISDEDRAAAAAEQERKAKEAEKQAVLASAQQKKAKKYTPEEAVVVLMEQGNDVATRLVGSRINKLRTQIDEINADENKDELEKWEDSKELSDQLAEYEAAVVKWLGQETLDAINATRVAPAAPVVEAAPVEEGPAVPPVQAQAVEPAQVEEPAEADTTPLPLAEPVIENGEVNEEEKEPMNLLDGQYAIVGSNSTRGKEQIVKVTQNEDGTETWTSIHDGSTVSQKGYKKQQFPEQDNMRVLGIKEGNEITPVIVLSGRADLSQEKGELKVVPVNTKDGKIHSVHVSLLYKPEADGGWSLLKGVGSRVLSPAEAAKYNSLDALLDFPIIPNVTVGNFTLRDMLEYPTLAKLKSRLEQLGIEYDKQTINTNLETALARWRELVRENNLNEEFKNNLDKLSPTTLAVYKLYRAGVEPFKAGVPVTDTMRTRSNINLYVQLDSIGMLPNNISNPLAQLAVLAEVASDLGIIQKKAKGSYLDAINGILEKTKKEVDTNTEEFTKPKETLEEKATEDKQPEQPKAETPKQQKPKAEAKEETPAPAKPKTNVDNLRDTFVEAYARTQNQSYNALQKTTAKTAFKGMIDKMSDEDAVALYLNLAMESAKSQGKMQEDMANAAQALLDSKHGAAINAITGGAQQETNQTPVEATEEATEETEQTPEDAIDYEALVAERNELQKTIYDMEKDEAANANARIAQINEILRNRPEFMEGNVTESSASQEAKELALVAEIQALTDSEEIDVINVTAEQAEEARRTGKPEMQISNETQRIFVSNAERAVESIKQEKATPQQWKAMIEKQGGLKAGEDKWLGLSEWLDNQDKKTLTKQEILDFIAKNRIIIAEVHYADGNVISEEDVLNSEAFSMLLEELWDWSGDEPVIDMQKFRELKDDDDFVDGFDTDYWNETLIVRDPAKAAKYLGIANPINNVRLEYTTSGLDEKREIAIVIPTIATWNMNDEIHFGDAGNGRAIAWVRFGETTDSDGNRVLVIDEIQSKRHQEGREKGYYTSSDITDVESLKTRVTDLERMAFDIRGKLDTMNISVTPGNMSNEDAAEYYKLQEELLFVRNNRDYDRINAEIDAIKSKYNQQDRENLDKKLKDINEELEKLYSALDKLNAKDRVPDAPFDKNWHELAFKRMLRYAAENGYDYVAWTTGEQQAQRYNIGDEVDKIRTTEDFLDGTIRVDIDAKNTRGWTLYVTEDGTITNRGAHAQANNWAGKPLSDVVGKPMAEKILSNKNQTIEGEGLMVGGEGMKGFYDKMLPSFVSKYTKKWGSKMQDINLPSLEESAQTMHAVNVTPEMKESVMEGQPMFSIESTPLMTSKGVIYGYALGNKIYLTPNGMNTNTPVHEYTHIWAKAMQKHNPKAWKSIVEQLKKAEALWNEVVNDPNYENIKNDEDAIASEVLSRYSGKNGAIKLEAEAERVASEYKGMEKGLKVKALISRVKKALEKFWSWVGKNLFEIESFESVESIADRVLYDMLNNTKLNLDNSKKSSTFAHGNTQRMQVNITQNAGEDVEGVSHNRYGTLNEQDRVNYKNALQTLRNPQATEEQRTEAEATMQQIEMQRKLQMEALVREALRGIRGVHNLEINGGIGVFLNGDAEVVEYTFAVEADIDESSEDAFRAAMAAIAEETKQDAFIVNYPDVTKESKRIEGTPAAQVRVKLDRPLTPKEKSELTNMFSEMGINQFGVTITDTEIQTSNFTDDLSNEEFNTLAQFLLNSFNYGNTETALHDARRARENGTIGELEKKQGFLGGSGNIKIWSGILEPRANYSTYYGATENEGDNRSAHRNIYGDQALPYKESEGRISNTNLTYSDIQNRVREVLHSSEECIGIIEEARANGQITDDNKPLINGKASNLPLWQWATVRTQAFKDWFGDWQNDPANASKVLDENGEPLVVYHGSKMAGFDEFQQLDESVNGFFTTDNKAGANTYATNREERRNNVMADEAQINTEPHHGIYSLFANIKNPAVYDFAGKMYNEYGEPLGYYVEMSGEEWDNQPIPKFATEEEALAFARENGEPDSAVKTTYLSTDDLVEIAKAAGHDGVIFKNVLDGAEHNEEMPVMNDYIAFEPNQLKSAAQNIGTFSSEDNRIEFMIGPAAPAGAPRDQSDPMQIDSEAARRLQAKSQKYFAELANPKAQLPSELNAMNELVAKLLDRTEGIRQIMESIKKFRKENGLPPIGEGFDVRTMIEAMDSKIANETKLFVMIKENELRKAIYKLAKRVEKSDFYKKYKYEKELKQNGKKNKLTPREIIERYLIACDSIEREELKGNPRGTGAFLRRMGVDMVQYRQEFLDDFANTQEGIDEINHLWETIRGVTDMVISEGERSGLISQEEAISYKRRRFYVPERDFAEVEANEELQVKDAGYGSGRMGNKLIATQEADGGKTLAANVLANMTLLARDAIVKANKNIVKLAMFDLLRANEEWCKANHVPIPRQVWYKRNPDGSVTRVTDGPTAPEKKIIRDLKSQIRDRENEIIQERMLAESATDAATRQAHMDIIAEIEEEIESLRQANPFLDEFDARDMMFLSRHTQKESTVTVFVDGVPCEMHFPNMTIVANALNGTTNKKFAAEGLKKLTSALSATMTVYNPAFFTVNVVRDIPFILAKGYAEYGWQFPMRFAGQLVKTFFTLDVWKAVAGNYKDVKSPYVREFFEGGGNTGYSTIPDIDKLKSATKRWDRRRTDIGMQDIGDVISYMNTFSEVLTRLAAYSVVREMGGTKEAGIRAAKNLSVNFNRKGLGAPIWDTFMNMSFFANAALQGASGFYRTFKGNKDTVAKNIALGFRSANAFLATPMFAGFISTLLHPDDDDELLWINDWDRDNYWYVGESGFRIAINEQIKPAWVIGVNIALGMKGRRTKEQIASSIISSVFTNWLPAPQNINGSLTMATNSYYGTKDYSTAQVIENLTVPQAMASFTDIANNVDFMGYKIKNEPGDLPAYMSNENSALLYKIVAEFLYEANGGDKDLPSKHIEVMNEDGTIDYKKMSDLYDKSPKEINTILSIAIGSTWKDFGNAIAVASTDGEFVPTDYQTIKRFYKPTDKEITILSIMREARGITKDYTEQYNNYINQIAGKFDGNAEKGIKARERIENIIGKGEDRGQKAMLKFLVNAYDANTMYSYAKQFGMNETRFKKSLEETRPDLLKAFNKYNSTSREELVRKILTLTRDIKDMEVKDNEFIDKVEDVLGVE